MSAYRSAIRTRRWISTRACWGFTKKLNNDMGGGVRWLTVGYPEQPDGPQVDKNPYAAYPAMKALRGIAGQRRHSVHDVRGRRHRAGMPASAILGVRFTVPPTPSGDVTYAVFDDTCGGSVPSGRLVAVVREVLWSSSQDASCRRCSDGRSRSFPSPFESTPVPIVNGRPDWNAVTPEICQPPSTAPGRRTSARGSRRGSSR